MKAIFQNLDCNQGASFTRRLRLRTAAGPRNLTGYTARMQVRATTGAPETILSLSIGAGLSVDGPAGLIVIALTPEETAAIKVPNANSDFPQIRKCVYDLQLIGPTPDDIDVLLRGNFTVTAGVTR